VSRLRRIVRSAITGRFATKADAKKHPAETVTETVQVRTSPPPLAYGVPKDVIRNTVWRETGDDALADQVTHAIMVELARCGHTFR